MTTIAGITLTPLERAVGIGAVAGLGAGAFLLRAPSRGQVAVAALLGAGTGALIGQVMAAKAAAQAAALPLSPLALVMAPGTFQENPAPGQAVTLTLPTGAAGWQSVTGAGGFGPTVTPEQLQNGSAISWLPSGPGTLAIVWVDANSQPQTTTLIFGNG